MKKLLTLFLSLSLFLLSCQKESINSSNIAAQNSENSIVKTTTSKLIIVARVPGIDTPFRYIFANNSDCKTLLQDPVSKLYYGLTMAAPKGMSGLELSAPDGDQKKNINSLLTKSQYAAATVENVQQLLAAAKRATSDNTVSNNTKDLILSSIVIDANILDLNMRNEKETTVSETGGEVQSRAITKPIGVVFPPTTFADLLATFYKWVS